jgi:hypothetical protein
LTQPSEFALGDLLRIERLSSPDPAEVTRKPVENTIRQRRIADLLVPARDGPFRDEYG